MTKFNGLEKGTLNLLCGGPSAGKTTLTYQSLAAHERGESFFVPPLNYPPGPIVVVNTDRSKAVNDQFFKLMGIHETHFISLVDERTLHLMTQPQHEDHGPLKKFRSVLGEKIAKFKPSTVILDLYGDFISGNAGSHKALGFDGRSNVQWAEDLNVAILALAYPYKQKSNNMATRVQDRIAGATAIQASSSWKINITDKTETKTCWMIDIIPPPMGGPPKTIYALRQDDADGIGPFHECDPPPGATVEAIMEQNGIGSRQASRYKKEDLDLWLETQKKKTRKPS